MQRVLLKEGLIMSRDLRGYMSVEMKQSNTAVKHGGGKDVATRYTELVTLGPRVYVYGRIVGMEGCGILLQWYIDKVQEGCIYLHGSSEIVKLGNGQIAATRHGNVRNPPFSEEVRIGFPRLSFTDSLAQESGEEGSTVSSPRRRSRTLESPNNSQSQQTNDGSVSPKRQR